MKYVNVTSIDNVENIIEELGLSNSSYVLVLILNLIIVVVGLVGNIFVLFSSLKYKAIKVDKISLLLLEALTMSDIAIITLYFSPMLITLCGKKWVLGSGMCFVTGVAAEIPFYFQVMVKTIISCYRLWVCMSNRSLRGPGIDSKIFIVKMGILALLIPSLAPAIVFFVHKSNFLFIPQILRCLSAHHSKRYGSTEAYKHLAMLTVTFIAIPTCIILITNASIWIIVKKSHVRSQRGSKSTKSNRGTAKRMSRTALMLTLICCAFVFCYLPTFVKFILYNLGHETSLFMYFFHSYALSLNSIVNPFIYLITNRHFRLFMKNFFRGIVKEKTTSTEAEHTAGQ